MAIKNDTMIPIEVCFPYKVSGYIGNPILGIFIIVLGLTFYLLFRKNNNKTTLFASISLIMWGFTGFIAAIGDSLYANAVLKFINGADISVLIVPGYVRGLSALIIGILGGIVFSILTLVNFKKNNNYLGVAGAVIMIISVIIGIIVKTYSIYQNQWLLMGIFLVMMIFKSIGLTLISIAIRKELIHPISTN